MELETDEETEEQRMADLKNPTIIWAKGGLFPVLGLLASVPRLDRPSGEDLRMIRGLPPNLARLPKGCAFAPRCDYAMPKCSEERPTLEQVGEGHSRACFYDADKLKRQE